MTYQAMTRSRWLQQVHDNASDLRELIADYHPSARSHNRKAMPITAPAAEQACQQVRSMIREEEPKDPLVKWDKALADSDIGTLTSLMEGAWFGVPESTECWSIPGFSKAVDLMDDQPEEP